MRGSYSPVSSYDSRECGRSLKEEEHTFRAKFRILNGTCARYGDFPWVAEIQLREVPKPTLPIIFFTNLESSSYLLFTVLGNDDK